MHTISRSIALAMLPTLLSAAPYLCRNNNATYQTQAHCNTACGTTCEELGPLTSGTSGSCDTANFEGFVYSNNITYAITKSTQFWTDTANLALPKDEQINAVLKGIASYYGGNAWIGVYDPLKSSNYNSVDPSRFKLSNGIALTYSNWSNGQPDNKLDNADIGVTAINGEHWVYMQSDATWLDDGYHAIFGGDYKPKRKALVEWNGPLDCANGTSKSTTSNTNGYYCGDGTGNVAQCTMGSVPSSSDACTLPATWDSASQKCKTTYTASESHALSCPSGSTFDSTIGLCKDNGHGITGFDAAGSTCSSAGMRLPTSTEAQKLPTINNGEVWSNLFWYTEGVAPGCGSYPRADYVVAYKGATAFNKLYNIWCNGIHNQNPTSAYWCVANQSDTTTYSCNVGDSLTGSTCTALQSPTCPNGTQLNTSTGKCDPISACTAPSTWDSATQQCKTTSTATYAATAGSGTSTYTATGNTAGGSAIIFTKFLDQAYWCYAPSGTIIVNHNNGYTYNGIKACGCPVGQTYSESYRDWHTNWASCSGTYYTCPDGGTLSGTTCTKTVTTYSCPDGGTLSSTTCTKDDVTYSSPSCPSNLVVDATTGNCATPNICPLGNYQCALINSSTIENTDTTEGANDKTDNGQTDESGKCLGTLYIFNGNDNRCRPSGVQTGGTDCCKKGTTWFGLGQCQESEKTLGKLREFGSLDGNCHYIGDYCSEKWPLVGCVQKKKTYCCFSSPLARIIQEGGRPQLGIGWGSPEAPQCRGFTPEEFQKIDFSKVNFSEWIQYDVVPNVQNNAVGNIQNVINNIDTNLAP